jgi:hypothetical protein
MTSCARIIVSVFLFTGLCIGQSPQGADAWMRLGLIDDVLRSADVSGSLIYQGSCGRTVPEAPPVRESQFLSPPTRALQEMLVDVPNMRVTQEPSGLVRMNATDVPTDLLDFKIHDMPFYSASEDTSMSRGANMAVLAIEMNPEVRAFRKAHGIHPYGDGFVGPGDASSGTLVVYGHLKDVTVSQALDYILQTFPGFWIYENCANDEGERTVRISFFKRRFVTTKRP